MSGYEKKYPLGAITDSIITAASELQQELQDPIHSPKDPGVYIHTQVYNAFKKARKDSGPYWKLKETKGRGGYALDADHTIGVFDALTQMIEDQGVVAARLSQANLTRDVLWKAEEILFDLNSQEGHTTSTNNH